MIKRTIEVSSRGILLRSRDRQLVIARDEDILSRVPFDDLGVLVLSGPGAQVSTGVLRSAVAAGAAVVICGDSFLPEGLLLPLASNSLHAARLRWQVGASKPLRKQLWAAVVRAKLRNQADLLPDGSAAQRSVERIAGGVRSGDSRNAEAQAGRVYWGNLFDGYAIADGFRRRRDGPAPNGLLNYGYAIVRAAVARALCVVGLHPALGIHHSNRTNPFCLADDLIEPFRPVVDAAVVELVASDELEVTKDSKRRLLEVLTDPVELDGERSPLQVAAERTARSLASCLEQGGSPGDGNAATAKEIAARLVLPKLVLEGRDAGTGLEGEPEAD